MLADRVRSASSFDEKVRAYFQMACFQAAGLFTVSDDEWLELQAHLVVHPDAPRS